LVVKAQASERTTKQLGESFEQNLLLNLGYAARIYPKLWQGLETDQPVSILMDLPEPASFARPAWVFESAGYKVIIPAWWTQRPSTSKGLRAKGSPFG